MSDLSGRLNKTGSSRGELRSVQIRGGVVRMTTAATRDVDVRFPSGGRRGSRRTACATARSARSAWRSRRTVSTSPIRSAARAGMSSREVIATVPDLPGGSAITVEPGGAVELSGPPADGRRRRDHGHDRRPRGAASSTFATHGLGLVLLGADPLRPGAAGQPRRPLPGDGALLRGHGHRRGRRGHDDLHRRRSRSTSRPARARAGRTGSGWRTRWARP